MNNNWKRKIALFLGSQAVTLFGSSVVQFAIVWFVTRETVSGFWVSMLTVCAYVPQFIISFFAGVWADRYSKKRLIILADMGIAVATLALAFSIPHITNHKILLIALLIISAIRAIGTGIQTPAVSALIPEIVPEEHYMRVNGVNATIQSIVQFAAPAVAGIVLSFLTFRTTLFIDIATAVIGVTLFSFVAVPNTKVPDKEGQGSMLADIKGGIRYVLSDRYLRNLFITNGLFILLCVPAGFLCALYVARFFGDSYAYLTTVELVGFAGMAAGGLLMSTWGGFKNRLKTLVFGMVAFGILAIGMGVTKHFIIYLVLMAVYGVAITMVQTATTTMLQEGAKPEMQGRVFGLFGAIYSSFLPLGMVAFGPLSDFISLRIIMGASGILLVLLAVFAGRTIRKDKIDETC